MPNQPVAYDVDGYDELTAAIISLINEYPALEAGEKFNFSVLNDSSGKAMFPVSGAVISSNRTSITGFVQQTCVYPFYIIYRAGGLSESRKKAVKEWLDNLGRWLELQSITVGTTAHKLDEYPTLTGGRRFTKFERTTPAYLDSINENNSENWVISINAEYLNQYQK